MNATVIEEWFKNQLLPNISPTSVIIMDNASDHSTLLDKPPTSSWRKQDMKDWLLNKGAQPSDKLSKSELYQLSKKFAASQKKYVIDTMAEEAGHKVVRLPPYHCQYNPIELIWAQVKPYCGKRNNFKMANLKNLVKEAVHGVTSENWRKAVNHTENLQQQDAKQDIAIEHYVDKFLINITDSDAEISEKFPWRGKGLKGKPSKKKKSA